MGVLLKARYGIGKMTEERQKVQTSSYKIRCEDVMYSMATILHTLLHI